MPAPEVQLRFVGLGVGGGIGVGLVWEAALERLHAVARTAISADAAASRFSTCRSLEGDLEIPSNLGTGRRRPAPDAREGCSVGSDCAWPQAPALVGAVGEALQAACLRFDWRAVIVDAGPDGLDVAPVVIDLSAVRQSWDRRPFTPQPPGQHPHPGHIFRFLNLWILAGDVVVQVR